MTINAQTTALALPFVIALAATAVHAQDRAFQFGLVGDTGYSKIEEQQFERVIAALNRSDLAFVIHVGDFQSDPRPYDSNPDRASMPCVEEHYQKVLASFQRIRHPFILTPGDNDWTDCHRLKAQKAEPLELLAKVRTMFFPPGRSLGQRTIEVESQAADPTHSRFRENLRWSMGGVTFATLHIVGSNDNFGRTPEMDLEHRERKAANIAWMKSAFATAKAASSRGLVLMTQANPAFENNWPLSPRRRYFREFLGLKPPDPPLSTGYDDYLKLLAEELEGYDKPVAFLHGDMHLFRVDKPLYSTRTNRFFENFTRVETFGSPDMHWVRVTVDPADPHLFRFDPQIVPENVVNRRTK